MSAIGCRALDVESGGIWLTRGSAIEEITGTPDLQASFSDYLGYYSRLDPWTIDPTRRADRVTMGFEVTPESELVRTEFYNDFARYYGMFRPMGFVTELEPGVMARCSFVRDATTRLLDEDDRRGLEALRPHFTRALRTRLRFRAAHVAEDAAYAAAGFDRLAFGVVICAASGRVFYANEAALGFELARCGLTFRGNPVQVGTAHRSDAEALSRLIFQAAWRIGGAGGPLRLKGESGPLVVLVTPLAPPLASSFAPPAETCGSATGSEGRAMLTIQREDAVPGLSAVALRRLYGLSPVQADLCRALAAGRTMEEAAAERGVATATMRTHLRTALERTGTHNLRDLLRLLGVLPPVTDEPAP